MALNDYDVFISQSPRGGRLCENQIKYGLEWTWILYAQSPEAETLRERDMALNDYDVFISQSPRGGRLCENQKC